ncbi:MAG: FAD:protein FMN transferase [Desulfobacterales bacterium]
MNGSTNSIKNRGNKNDSNRGTKKIPVITAVVVLMVAAVLVGMRGYNRYRFHLEKDVALIMDSYVSIYAIGPQKITAPAIAKAFDRMREVDAKFNAHNPESPVYAFNHDGIPISDPEIIDVVSAALDISRRTGGAFDITIGPLLEIWGFTGGSPHLPSEKEIRESRDRIGYEYLVVSDGRLEKRHPEIHIDLGAIAKGYNVGQAVLVLKENNVSSALIDAGGDVFALGRKGNTPWKVGIRNTRSAGVMGYIEAEDIAILGSGDYERYFIENGRRYHHIIDPATGYPVETLSGVTLLHPDPMIADAWATAVFVLGPAKGLEAVERIPDMEALMVTSAGEKIMSSGVKGSLKQLNVTD